MLATSVSFLGPIGTYSHQAAHDLFGDRVIYQPQTTIQGTFDSLGSQSEIAILPYENSIHGHVVETLNALRSDRFGRDAFLRRFVTLKISHCLVLAAGANVENITQVFSHEQGLAQCQKFLSAKLSRARLLATTSTAEASRMLSAMPKEEQMRSAAISCSICVEIYAGLEICQRDIQDQHDNFTRFLILSHLPRSDVPTLKHDIEKHRRASLIRISPPIQPEPAMHRILAGISLPIMRLDRRPQADTHPFHDVYFIEVTSGEKENNIEETVAHDMEKLNEMGCDTQPLGFYPWYPV